MRSALPIVIVALLVSSLLSVAVVAEMGTPGAAIDEDDRPASVDDQSQVAFQADPADTTSRQRLTGSSVNAYTTMGPDLGTTLAASNDELDQEWRFHGLEYEWDSLSQEERTKRVTAYTDRLLQRSDELTERDRAVVRAMADGDATPDRVVRTFARSDHEAEIILENLDRLSQTAASVPDLKTIIRPVRGTIETHGGPVRSSAYNTLSAAGSSDASTIILVEVAESGAVVSTVSGQSYARGSHRFDNRASSGPDQITDISGGTNRLNVLYPWARSDEVDTSNSYDQFLSQHLYSFEIHHVQGRLSVYMDSRTTDIFREVQELRLDEVPSEPIGTWSGESAVVSVNATPSGGPLHFNVTNSTGHPVNATILADDQPIAETGEDGSTWVVRPMSGQEFTVQAEAETIAIDPDS
ncbi:DUF7096 domain-containing protein [Halovivax cerinus]|uniref:Uncharacterized protein n=1 Tax=Halovivax cerinus TaxID=1487865 RepID=A0ABD5NKR2_9EURY|nr:hypothetical protein [Halovivax cerinus]